MMSERGSGRPYVLPVLSIVLALPFPILIIILWATLEALKGQASLTGALTMNAIILYAVQFFIIPLLSLTSVITAMILSIKGTETIKKLSYVALAITTVGLILMGLFLNRS